MEQGSILSHSPPQPHPASSLEVSIVVLPKCLQDDGDDCHEGFHNAELQCGLHREETRCTTGRRTSHSPHPTPPLQGQTHTQRREQCWEGKYEPAQGLQTPVREWGFQKAAPERQPSQSRVGDQRAWGQMGDRIQPTVQSWRVRQHPD